MVSDVGMLSGSQSSVVIFAKVVVDTSETMDVTFSSIVLLSQRRMDSGSETPIIEVR